MEWKYWTLFTGTFVTVVYLYRAEIKKILNFIYRKIPENCPGPESEYAGLQIIIKVNQSLAKVAPMLINALTAQQKFNLHWIRS